MDDFARVVLMLYESSSMICKPNAFNVWYRLLCEVVGCRYVESYHPHNIGRYEKIRRMFYYVEFLIFVWNWLRKMDWEQI